MTTSLIPVPKFREFTIEGSLPLNGGLVYSYAAGTSTPLATYTDQSGLTSNANPVILDAAGRANIWLSDGVSYKIVLEDSVGNIIYTIDNVSSGGGSSSNTNGGFGEADDIDSAAQVDLGTIASHFANIIGTVNITSFGSTALTTAPIYLIKFNGSLTLTQNSSILLPNSTSIVTQSGDRAWIEYLGSGVWRVFAYERITGVPLYLTSTNSIAIPANSTGSSNIVLAEDTDNGTDTITLTAPAAVTTDRVITLPDASGTVALTSTISVLQVLSSIVTTASTSTSASWVDVATVSITPSSNTNKVLVQSSICGAQQNATGSGFLRLCRDTTAIGVGTSVSNRVACGCNLARAESVVAYSHSLMVLDSPATTSAITYRVQVFEQGGTAYINRSPIDTDDNTSARGATSITVTEVLA